MGFAISQGWDLPRGPSGWDLLVALGFQNPRSQRRWEMGRSHEALALGFEAWDLVLGSALRDFEKPLNFSISISETLTLVGIWSDPKGLTSSHPPVLSFGIWGFRPNDCFSAVSDFGICLLGFGTVRRL